MLKDSLSNTETGLSLITHYTNLMKRPTLLLLALILLFSATAQRHYYIGDSVPRGLFERFHSVGDGLPAVAPERKSGPEVYAARCRAAEAVHGLAPWLQMQLPALQSRAK